MLLECENCGAPLDVAQGKSTTRCNYCGKSSQVERARTIAVETPADFQPPKEWTPPPDRNLPHHALKYTSMVARMIVRTIALVVFLMILSGGVTAYLAFQRATENPLAASPDINKVFAQATAAIEQAQAAAQAARGVATPPALPVVCGGNDEMTLTGQVLSLPNGVPVQADGNCEIRLVACTVSGITAVSANGNTTLVIEGGSFTGTEEALALSGNATLEASGATISGSPAIKATSNATGRVRASTVTGKRLAVQTSSNARVDTTGSVVTPAPAARKKR